MTPRAPLSDDWLYWDPVAIPSYPHSRDYDERVAPPEQLARAAAAAGVQEEAGMLVYVELASAAGGAGGDVATAELVELLQGVGVTEPLVLAEPLSIALGGDTDLAGRATRLTGEGARVELYRRPGPGARRIFPDTRVVPLKEWYPLQARRIRYFKKKKKEDGDDGSADP